MWNVLVQLVIYDEFYVLFNNYFFDTNILWMEALLDVNLFVIVCLYLLPVPIFQSNSGEGNTFFVPYQKYPYILMARK